MRSQFKWHIVLAGLWASSAQAEVMREVRFESVPPGAEVMLLEGSRQVPIGVTPVVYTVEFHSEMSVLRFGFKKPGYEPRTIDVNASQSHAVVNLEARGFAEPPSSISDPRLRRLQEFLAPIVNNAASSLVGANNSIPYEIGRARVVSLGATVFLVVPVEITQSEKERINPERMPHDEFLRLLWDQVGKEVASAIGLAVHRGDSSIGMILDVGYERLQQGFVVGSRVETAQTIECKPGTVKKQVYNPCYRTKVLSAGGWECEGKWENKEEYSACASKEPVVHTRIVADPKISRDRANLKAQYVLAAPSLSRIAHDSAAYSRVGVLLTNAKGEVVVRRGELPGELPQVP